MERNNVNNSPITGEDSKKEWTKPEINECKMLGTEASSSGNNFPDGGGLYDS
ncbi:MAG: hypothetical protein PVH64_11445 [Bacillota bacterium]|jgi:hypothetical protein